MASLPSDETIRASCRFAGRFGFILMSLIGAPLLQAGNKTEDTASTQPTAQTVPASRPTETLTRTLLGTIGSQPPAGTIIVDYPADKSIFPPEMVAPEFCWHDSADKADRWLIDIVFPDNQNHTYFLTDGKRPPLRIDLECLGPTNEIYKGTDYQQQAKGWAPDESTWKLIKTHSGALPVTIRFLGFHDVDSPRVLSAGQVTISTSSDPVGAPIFYRDVPLMPSETEEGTIKPLATGALPLIAWRLRDISRPQGRAVMKGLPTCANCHSFSTDGRTVGMDMDGPQGDKGAYAFTTISPEIVVTEDQLITWNSFKEKPKDKKTIGFMSQVSPDGRYVVSTVNEDVFVINFKEYQFLQVFYPTRGILAVYQRDKGEMIRLPGADDPQFVHCSPCWSPDGRYIVFCRASAKDPYTANGRPAKANDPQETPVQYDLYRIPFNEGKGGKAEPLMGASANGMSNSFPKYSPDNKWIVFVKARNGLLMRPDSRLYMITADGGAAREMNCNMKLMNSWHTWSPNSRWLAFVSKSNTPYTQLFLTHVDANGNDSPPILVPRCTMDNRAVNIPEFINIASDGIVSIKAPAVDFARFLTSGDHWLRQGRYDQAIAEFKKTLAMNPECSQALYSVGFALQRQGKLAEAATHYAEALKINPGNMSARLNMGNALDLQGRGAEAIEQYAKVLERYPNYMDAHYNMGLALARMGRNKEAIAHYRQAIRIDPRNADTRINLGLALSYEGQYDEAIVQLTEAIRLAPTGAEACNNLGTVFARKGDMGEAIRWFQEAVKISPGFAKAHSNLAGALAMQGKKEEANSHYVEATRLAPEDAELPYNWANLLVDEGQVAEAIHYYEQAIQLAPQWPQPLISLARLLVVTNEPRFRDPIKAINLAKRACELTRYQDPWILDVYATACANAGDFSLARSITDNAINLATRAGETELVQELQRKRLLYDR